MVFWIFLSALFASRSLTNPAGLGTADTSFARSVPNEMGGCRNQPTVLFAEITFWPGVT